MEGTDRCNDRCQPKRKCKTNQAKQESDSAIGTHLLSSVECGNSYNEECFRSLSWATSAFHLKVLEAVLLNFGIPHLADTRSFFRSATVLKLLPKVFALVDWTAFNLR